MKFSVYIVLWACLLAGGFSLAQEDATNDNLTEDTIPKSKHPFKKAALYSAIIPGGGQVYNHLHLPKTSRRKWNVYWKVPLIYAAVGGSAYLMIDRQLEIGNLKQEYRVRKGMVEGSLNPRYVNFDDVAILQLHNNAQRQRDLFILTTVLAYAVNVLDAAVEAHFICFDIGDDLSMRITPTIQTNFALGMTLALNFK